jgi:ArsR family transcriptional regulator
MNSELCVCEIETLLDITQSNASRHLNKLKQAGLIDSFKKAQWVYYKVKPAFEEKHQKLYEYLNENLVLEKDLKRLNAYKNSNLTCNCIKDDKEKVMAYLKREVLE